MPSGYQKEVYQEEDTMAVGDYIKSKGLDPEMYFASVNGDMKKVGDTIKTNDDVAIIPIVKGG